MKKLLYFELRTPSHVAAMTVIVSAAVLVTLEILELLSVLG